MIRLRIDSKTGQVMKYRYYGDIKSKSLMVLIGRSNGLSHFSLLISMGYMIVTGLAQNM